LFVRYVAGVVVVVVGIGPRVQKKETEGGGEMKEVITHKHESRLFEGDDMCVSKKK